MDNLSESVNTEGFRCNICPHHPIFLKHELKAHRDLHEIQKSLKESTFRDIVKIPLDHPMIAISNPRFIQRCTSRTGVEYYMLTNPVVLARKAEEDLLVKDKYDAALDRLNQAQGNNETLPLIPSTSPMSMEESTFEIEQKPAVAALVMPISFVYIWYWLVWLFGLVMWLFGWFGLVWLWFGLVNSDLEGLGQDPASQLNNGSGGGSGGVCLKTRHNEMFGV